MSVSEDGDDFRPIGEDSRLTNLDARLDRLEASEAERTGSHRPGVDDNARMANRVLADLIGGIAGGALVGWLLDRLVGTWPWGFMIVLFLGIIVAFRNIFRLASASAQSANDAGKQQ
jgi:ATP synthase protein I